MDTICPDLLCQECNSHREIIVDRFVEGLVVRIGDKVFTTRPTERSRFCYYHNKKNKGYFGEDGKPGSGLFNLKRTKSQYTRK